MNKELDALKRIYDLIIQRATPEQSAYAYSDYKIIETALKKEKQYKVSKMNKGLEALERFYSLVLDENTPFRLEGEIQHNLDIIENALKDYERLVKMRKTAEWADEKLQTKKKLKALEIIKEKNVDVQLLKDSKNLNEYNWCVHTKDRALTQEEYDLLKEVLL